MSPSPYDDGWPGAPELVGFEWMFTNASAPDPERDARFAAHITSGIAEVAEQATVPLVEAMALPGFIDSMSTMLGIGITTAMRSIVEAINERQREIMRGFAISEDVIGAAAHGSSYELGRVREREWQRRVDEARSLMISAVEKDLTGVLIGIANREVRRSVPWRGKRRAIEMYTLEITGTVAYTLAPPTTPGRRIVVQNVGRELGALGFRHERIILDDPFEPVEVTDEQRDHVRQWFARPDPRVRHEDSVDLGAMVREVYARTGEIPDRLTLSPDVHDAFHVSLAAAELREVRRERRRRRMRRVRRRGW